jgi:hypothetical protein
VREEGELFVLVAGVGHCGTKWLAHVLNRPHDGIVSYHEQKMALVPGGWHDLLRYGVEHGADDLFTPYFDFMRRKLEEFRVVADSNSWTFQTLPAVHDHLPIDLVVCVVRNGIQNVHSMFHENLSLPRNDWFYGDFIDSYRRLVGPARGDRWLETTWGIWCFYWSLNLTMPTWLAGRIGAERCVVYRLEDLTKDPSVLGGLLAQLRSNLHLSHTEFKALSRNDVNRKISGDRSPARLWERWTDWQRETFAEICGLCMEHYGYDTPTRPWTAWSGGVVRRPRHDWRGRSRGGSCENLLHRYGAQLAEEQREATVHHSGDFPLSWMPKRRLKSVPFAVDQPPNMDGHSPSADARRTVMSITPPRIPWHFGWVFALDFNPAPDTAYLLEIDAWVTQGTIGFGLWNKEEEDFSYRVAVAASPKRALVHLPIAGIGGAGRLVVQQWDSDKEAHVDIMGLNIWQERAWWDLQDDNHVSSHGTTPATSW